MADLVLVKIDELEAFLSLVQGIKIPGDNAVDTRSFTLAQLRAWLFDSPELAGTPTVQTASLGTATQQVASCAFVSNALSGAGLTSATATTLGTVRTNSTVAVPFVYLRTEVDVLLTAVKPIAEGGTGAINAVAARSNLGAAILGVNNDITQLSALSSVPTVVSNAISAALPPGAVLEYAGSTAPSGYLMCDGGAHSRATYAALFAVIGTIYGVGNGSTTFNVPHHHDRFALGAWAGKPLGTRAGADLKSLGAAENGTHNHFNVTSVANIDHQHFGNTAGGGSHAHYTSFFYGNVGGGSAVGVWQPGSGNGANTDVQGSHGHAFLTDAMAGNQSHSHTISQDGTGQAFSLLTPYIAMNFIIKT